jgi:hypothetical protein
MKENIMNTHPYLRAYLAGVFVPTLVLPLMLAGFITVRLVLALPVPIERFVIFPMAVVPTLWGIWNMLWLRSHARTSVGVGLHGAALPVLLMPLGAMAASCLGILAIGLHGVVWFNTVNVPYTLIAPLFLVALAGYYLVWKYIVGFLNSVMGIA